MNKISAKALRLSAIPALIVLGGGVTPVHAGWEGVNDTEYPYAPLNLSISNASASIGQTGATSDSTNPDPDSGPGTVTVSWRWDDTNTTPPTSVKVTHNIGAVANLASSLTATGPSSVLASFRLWDTNGGPLDNLSRNSKVYNYVSHQVETPHIDSAPQAGQQAVWATPTLGADGIHYYISASFGAQISSHAEAFSSYYFNNNQAYNFGYGNATVTGSVGGPKATTSSFSLGSV